LVISSKVVHPNRSMWVSQSEHATMQFDIHVSERVSRQIVVTLTHLMLLSALIDQWTKWVMLQAGTRGTVENLRAKHAKHQAGLLA